MDTAKGTPKVTRHSLTLLTFSVDSGFIAGQLPGEGGRLNYFFTLLLTRPPFLLQTSTSSSFLLAQLYEPFFSAKFDYCSPRSGHCFLYLIFVCFGCPDKVSLDANTESDLAGYQVYYGTPSGTYGTPINVGNVVSYTLTGLVSGQTYFIAVTAFDTAVPPHESGYSNEVSGVATDPGAAPSAPTLSRPPTEPQV